jgi:hypothetical protein
MYVVEGLAVPVFVVLACVAVIRLSPRLRFVASVCVELLHGGGVVCLSYAGLGFVLAGDACRETSQQQCGVLGAVVSLQACCCGGRQQ